MFETGFVKTADGESIEATAYVSTGLGRMLQEMVIDLRAEVALEVGLAQGASAMFVADVLTRSPRTRFIAMDPLQEDVWRNVGLNNLRRSGHGSIVDFYPLPSHQALPRLEMEGAALDFAFIDGWHTFDYALVDFFYVDRMLRAGGIVALDDCQYPGIRKLCRYIATNLHYSVHRCLAEDLPDRLPMRHRALRVAGRWRDYPVGRPLSRLLRPEIVEPDPELQLRPAARCIAFRKERVDTRHWHFHRPF
jgi:predicted O-methyltransferase YrrM